MRVNGTETTLSGNVYDTLRADILACRIPPSARLRPGELSERFEVSLGAVREALSQLASEALVVAEAHKGFTVAPVSIDDLRDLTATRMAIEGLCLEQAIAAGGVDWETMIVSTSHRLARTPYKAEGDASRLSDSWNSVHGEFHRALVAACPSPRLLKFRALLFEQSERYRRLSVPIYQKGHGRDRSIDAEHGEIVKAAIAHDTARAVKLMKKHIELTSRILIEGLERIPVSRESPRPASSRRFTAKSSSR